MKRNQQRLTLLSLVVVLLFVSSSLSSVRTKAYVWDVTQTVTLLEYDNTSYGVLTGNHAMENQYLEAQYATDIRYVREGFAPQTDSMANVSSDFRTSFSEDYYQTSNQFIMEDGEWTNFPTYLQAFNNTGTGPNLNFTVGYKDQGSLSLTTITTIEMEADILYRYTVNLQANDLYDLDIRTTGALDYVVFFEGQESVSDQINGFDERAVQLLPSRGKGEYVIYFYSAAENYVIMEPRAISVNHASANNPISGFFVNEPDEIWNEERHLFEDNPNKINVDAYYFDLAPGDYQFKYINFDNVIDSQAVVVVPISDYRHNQYYSYMDFPLGDGFPVKYNLHLDYDTQIMIIITSDLDPDPQKYVEFDYILSIMETEVPIIEEGIQTQYQDNQINFGINIEETQMFYMNYSLGGITNLVIQKQEDAATIREYTYQLQEYGENAEKLILDPGYYSFTRSQIGTYDFILEFHTIDYEVFNTTSMIMNLEQENGDVANYKLLKLELPKFEYVNYNFSMTMQENYTVDLSYQLFVESRTNALDTYDVVLGNQQDDGIFQGYPQNDTQSIEFFSIRPNSVRYLLIYMTDVYNNTGYSWNDKGDAYVNQTSVQIRIKDDPGYPEVFDNINIHMLDANLSELGEGTFSTSFTGVENPRDLYIFNTTLPDLTWYKIRIVMVNGTRSNSNYDFDNLDSFRPINFERTAIWNEYYYREWDEMSSLTTYDGSNISNVVWESEFGVYSPNLIFMFNVYHGSENGTFSIEFIPYNCTEITPYDFTVGGGISKGAIIGLSIAAGLVAAGGIAVLVIKVVVPKIKSKTPM